MGVGQGVDHPQQVGGVLAQVGAEQAQDPDHGAHLQPGRGQLQKAQQARRPGQRRRARAVMTGSQVAELSPIPCTSTTGGPEPVVR